MEGFALVLVPRGFLAHERARDKTREKLWAHTLGPLNTPIQSEAVIEVSESDSDSQTACDWIGVFKGPYVCTQRFSHVSSLRLTLVVPGYFSPSLFPVC